MYSREYFVERFREAETDELLERMAGGELTDEAQQAIQLVLKERGVSQAQLAPMVREAKKARYRRTTPTNECDFCGKSPGFLASAVKDAGQKFCSRECLRKARLLEVAVDIPQEEIVSAARQIKNGACPSCGGRDSDIEVRNSYWVWSALFITRWGTEPKIRCRACGIRANFTGMLSSAFLGWWGFPWGLIITPSQIIANIAGMFRRTDPTQPSEELVQAAMFQLAAARRAPPASGAR